MNYTERLMFQVMVIVVGTQHYYGFKMRKPIILNIMQNFLKRSRAFVMVIKIKLNVVVSNQDYKIMMG